jgi:hypothetical protein
MERWCRPLGGLQQLYKMRKILTQVGQYQIVQANNIDPHARQLAQRLDGWASVHILGPDENLWQPDREFDLFNDMFVGQNAGSINAFDDGVLYISKRVRSQMKATFLAARAVQRRVLYNFSARPGQAVHPYVVAHLALYARRYGVHYEVNTLDLTND